MNERDVIGQPAAPTPVACSAWFGIIVENLKTRFWAWRLRRIKRITGTIGFHPYPPDTETGWRKDRKDYLGIKATSRLVRRMKL